MGNSLPDLLFVTGEYMNVFAFNREKEFSMRSVGVFKSGMTKFGIGYYGKEHYLVGLNDNILKAFKLKGISQYEC